VIESASLVKRRAGRRTPEVADVLAGLRMRQWSKNLLLFAGLLFASKLGDAGGWAEACLAFAAFCAASSAAYLVNDVRDAEADRRHPAKRRRPVARGALSPRAAVVLAVCLGVAAVSLAGAVRPVFAALLACFLALQLVYSWGLKRVVAIDVLTIALLFTIRAGAGAVAVDVRVSAWLLACTALLALFLALGKRRAELSGIGASHRVVLARYSLGAIDRLLVLVAAATIGAYCAYAFTARDSLEMVATIPFVAAGVGRYLVLIHRDGLGEAPEDVLLGDRPTLIAAALWTLTAVLVLATS
jgi:4-hydroxybenzoate polyprenyltransferase